MAPRRIFGVEKNYDWGDETTIRRALGLAPTRGTRVAELWLGTHPMGPARLDNEDGPLMSEVTGNMTMLVKLLACAQPLSLQTHPTLEQAREGFAREEALGIARDAPNRMYRDDSDKPEMIVALSRFEALCGFAPVDQSLELLRDIGWAREADRLRDDGIAAYIEWALTRAEPCNVDSAPDWLKSIAELHPGDRALRVAPILNHVVLHEGEALSLPAGNLHAYLNGFGLEVMNSSDNVIRAGFTSKHVDAGELLRIVDTSPLHEPRAQIDESRVGDFFESPSGQFSVCRFAHAELRSTRHRIIYGTYHHDESHRDGHTHPAAYLLAAGDNDDVDIDGAWMCVQD